MGKTPMMQQYFELKKAYQEHILFFRLGDFYEMFFDDAKIASQELELTLTGRDCGEEERAPMCGVPYHSSEAYIARLVKKGYKIAVCEQTEDPKMAQGLVKREVVRIITPGTVIESSLLEENSNNFIASIYLEKDKCALSFADVSTGEMYVTILKEDAVHNAVSELGKFVPKEVLANGEASSNDSIRRFVKDRIGALLEQQKEDSYDEERGRGLIKNQFDDGLIDPQIFEEKEMILSLGVLVEYLRSTQMIDLRHLRTLNFYSQNQFMGIDTATKRNLELTENAQRSEKKGSLLWVLDQTKTSMGGRLLKKWVEQPLNNLTAITKRHRAVSELTDNLMLREELKEALSSVYDLERMLGRIVYGTANGRDLSALSETLKQVPKIKDILSVFKSSYFLELQKTCFDLPEVYELIGNALVDEPPFSIREGGVIRDGFNSDLDELRSIVSDGKGYITKLENTEREKTGIKNLKIGYNKVFGYYIEVTKSYYQLVPGSYIRKQTLANCERYITDELKKFEGMVLGAREKIQALEFDLFVEVRNKITSYIHKIQSTAHSLAQIDALLSFAQVAVQNNYTMPQVDTGGEIQILGGRHPVVEKMLSKTLFVPNDTFLNGSSDNMLIITGPNMAGKSTYMRQTAIIVLMAHIGSFVPAESARICMCDKIFTRVGASDDLSSGQSTFMVEMNEVANILNNATKNSLIIYDEIGRGTSTFDGVSIAQAVLEYTVNKKKLGAKTLFATHYHELTELEERLPGVKNYSVAVKRRGDEITFLHKIIRGAADDSYGIEVAKVAGVPSVVTERAKEILLDIERGEGNLSKMAIAPKKEEENSQLDLLDAAAGRINEKLQRLNLDTLTPIEALNFLHELKQEIE